MPTWDSLLPEIRVMILGELERHPQKGAYAAVSKEWQAVIEKSTFRRLKLKEACLDDFDRIVQHQRGSVRHCLEPTREGLTLELNAYSTSDKEHWHKTCYLGTLEEDALLDSGRLLDTGQIDDPGHGWVHGRQVSPPPSGAIRRIYEDLNIKFHDQLPQVEVVTKFLIRRQCRRQWTPPTLQRIWEKLPRLEEIVYEPWQLCEKPLQEFQRDGEYYKMVTSHLPLHLKKLSVFEDFNETFLSLFQTQDSFLNNEPLLLQLQTHFGDLFNQELLLAIQNDLALINPDRVRVTSRQVAEGFAARSLGLEQLSVAFMAEARYFMDAAKKTWTWHELRSLSLTSRLMSRESSSEEISRLLHDAGAVALHMPELEMMNIWNGAQGEACAFMYRQEDSSITWRGTWEFKLSHDVLQSWKKVVARFARNEMQVRHQLLGCEILSHGDAIHYLDLAFVIDPVSLVQIRRENEQSCYKTE
ncbi:unnamed protein product [Clonostachys rosea]|uniref:DUF6546 domain-containing protein n=1 Tax=Bionectria ochroleuca TaxID=29856 RepID=A0ABY6ULZ8_BIOOC|nr:unnamed protein product [Clonostachys rosea]